MGKPDTETDRPESDGTTRESEESIREAEGRDADDDEDDDDDWGFDRRKAGLATETKAGLGVIVLLTATFALLVYLKFDRHASELIQAKINPAGPAMQKGSFETDEPSQASEDFVVVTHNDTTGDLEPDFDDLPAQAEPPEMEVPPSEIPNGFGDAIVSETGPVDSELSAESSGNFAPTSASEVTVETVQSDEFATDDFIPSDFTNATSSADDDFHLADAGEVPADEFAAAESFPPSTASSEEPEFGSVEDPFVTDAAEVIPEATVSSEENVVVADSTEDAVFDFDANAPTSASMQPNFDTAETTETEPTEPDFNLNELANAFVDEPVETSDSNSDEEPGDDLFGNFESAAVVEKAQPRADADPATVFEEQPEVASVSPEFDASPFTQPNELTERPSVQFESGGDPSAPVALLESNSDEVSSGVMPDFSADPKAEPLPQGETSGWTNPQSEFPIVDDSAFDETRAESPTERDLDPAQTLFQHDELLADAQSTTGPSTETPPIEHRTEALPIFDPLDVQLTPDNTPQSGYSHGVQTQVQSGVSPERVPVIAEQHTSVRQPAETQQPIPVAVVALPPVATHAPEVDRTLYQPGFSGGTSKRRSRAPRIDVVSETRYVESDPDNKSSQIHTVRDGESYWSISKSRYGTSRYYMALALYNQSRVSDPRRLRTGTKIVAPSIEVLEDRYPDLFRSVSHQRTNGQTRKEPAGYFHSADGQPMYRVGADDTLSAIAERHLGKSSRWMEVFRLNRHRLQNPHDLKPGTVLTLPVDASQVILVR